MNFLVIGSAIALDAAVLLIGFVLCREAITDTDQVLGDRLGMAAFGAVALGVFIVITARMIGW